MTFLELCDPTMGKMLNLYAFLADRTIGRAYATVSRLSVVRRPSSVRL